MNKFLIKIIFFVIPTVLLVVDNAYAMKQVKDEEACEASSNQKKYIYFPQVIAQTQSLMKVGAWIKANVAVEFYGNKINIEFAGALAKFLKKTTQLRVLEFAPDEIIHYGFGDEEFEIICSGLRENSSVRFLGLCLSQITDQGVSYLAIALQKNTTLTALDLYACQSIADAGAEILSKVLEKNSALAYLNLLDTGIEFEGGKHIARSLGANCSLTDLSLQTNRHDCVGEIANSLKANTSLVILKLKCDRILPVSIVAIADMLMTNSTLKKIKLISSDFCFNAKKEEKEALAELSKALEFNSTLVKFGLKDNCTMAQDGHSESMVGPEADAIKGLLASNRVHEKYPNFLNDICTKGCHFNEILLCCDALPSELIEILLKHVLFTEKKRNSDAKKDALA